MNTYRVTLIYQNIESGGSTRYRSVYYVEASGEATALRNGLERLGCNRDGRLYSSQVSQIFVSKF